MKEGKNYLLEKEVMLEVIVGVGLKHQSLQSSKALTTPFQQAKIVMGYVTGSLSLWGVCTCEAKVTRTGLSYLR